MWHREREKRERKIESGAREGDRVRLTVRGRRGYEGGKES